MAGAHQLAPRAFRSGRTPVGLVAVLDGVTYRCAGIDRNGMARLVFAGSGHPPDPGFRRAGPDEPWSAMVPADRCARVAEVSHRAWYQGREWLLSWVDDEATELTLSLVADPVAVARVELTAPTELHETHRDEKFRFWQWRSLGFVPGPTTPPDRVRPELSYPGLRLGRFATVDGLTYPVAGTGPIAPGEPIVLVSHGPQPHPDAVLDEASGAWRRAVGPDKCGRLVDITGFAGYQGADHRVGTAWPGGLVSIAPVDGASGERQVPVGALYDYREVHRNLLFDLWRASRLSPA